MSTLNVRLLYTLAWRNVWRNHRRTFVILVAIAFGIWSMVTLAAIMRGMIEQQVRNAINNLTGHIQVHAVGYRDDPVVDNSMPPPAPHMVEVLRGEHVRAWSTRVSVPAVVASERESAGVTLVGVDPEAEHGLSFIAKAVTEGRYLKSPGDHGVLLGRKLAERLETSLGKRVVVMSQDVDNEIADRGFRVVGIFDANMEATETGYVFTGRSVAQEMLRLGENISELAVVARDRQDLSAVLQLLVRVAPGLDIQPWTKLEPLLVLTVKMYEATMLIWFVVVFLAMSFGLINTLLMAVFERTREIGLFQALGMRPGFLLSQVLLESLMVLMIGLFMGNVLAWGTIAFLADGLNLSAFAEGLEWAGISSVIYPLISASDVISANLLVVVLGIVASLYPAWRAARRVPVEAITRT
ncbi:MAG: ABC transporter permease [Deltaproteobacteria bacterium]|nr:ABC transporter permease [Deltaproteobacteria bacterium]